MAIDPLTAGLDLAGKLVEKFFPDKSEQERQQLAATLTIINGQLSVNAEEAKHASVFVSGWRPFIGWVCGGACAWNWIGISLAKFICELSGKPLQLAPADLAEMLPVLIGMLGIGSLRTYEKINKVASK